MSRTLSLTLPWPPSVNHYYGRRGRHVYLKPEGKLYRRKAAVEFARLRWPRLNGAVEVHLILTPPDNRRRDIDNIRKAVYDALSDRAGHVGVIMDDALIKADSAEFGEPEGKEGWVEIHITEMEKNNEEKVGWRRSGNNRWNS